MARFCHPRRRIGPRPPRTPRPAMRRRPPRSPPRPHIGTRHGARPHGASPRWRPAGPTRTSGPAPGWPRRHLWGVGWGLRGSPQAMPRRRRRWRPVLRGWGGGPRAAPWCQRYGSPMAVGRAWRVGEESDKGRMEATAPYGVWGAPSRAPRRHRVTARWLPAPLLGQERGRGRRKPSTPPPPHIAPHAAPHTLPHICPMSSAP